MAMPFGSPAGLTPQMPPPNVGPDAPNADLIGKILAGQPAVRATNTDPYADDAALIKTFRDFHKMCFEQRWSYERNWWRNLLYTLGRQWIFYNQQRGAWQDKRMQKWIPRPVTNKIAETLDSMRSVFQGVQLDPIVRPVSDDPMDTQTAETAENLAPTLHAEHDMDFRMFESDFWTIETGNAFWHPWFDKRAEHGTMLVPFEKCVACQQAFGPGDIVKAGHKCPNCGSPNFEQQVGQDGKPVGTEYPIGRGATDVCSPFEIGFPSGYGSFDDLPGVIRQRWRNKDYYERFYPDIAKTLHWEKSSGERSIQMLKALASQSDVAGTSLGTQTTDGQNNEGITEYELWLKPSPTYPRGLFARFVGQQGSEQVLREEGEQMPGPLPMVTAKGQPIFPWIHAAYQRFGGRVWARSPLDLIIQKQDQINQLDSLILLGVQRMSNPVWIEPKGSEVKKFTGEPGLVVKYNPLVAGGNAKPERIKGENIPSSLLALRQQYLSDIESLAGTQDVLKGAKPSGVSAFSAMQLLVERAQSRFGPVLSERGETYRKWFQFALEIERQFGQDERIVAAMGANRRWTFSTFKNADIQGAVRVLIEDGSQAPKTNLGKRAAVEQLKNLGLLNPNDPDQKMKIYQVFGETELLPSLDAAVQGCLAEQAAFEEWAKSPMSMPLPQPMAPAAVPPTRRYFDDGADGTPSSAGVPPAPPPLNAVPPSAPPQGAPGVPPAPPVQQPGPPAAGAPPPAPPAGQMGAPPPPQTLKPCPLVIEEWHPDDVHVSEHTKWGNSDAARLLFVGRPDIKALFTQHLMMHKQRVMMAEMAMQGGAAGAPQEQPGQGSQRSLQNSNQNAGMKGANQAPPA